MSRIFRFLIFSLCLCSCRMTIGDCTKWGDIAMKSFENARRLYQLDSSSFINFSPFLNNKLQGEIIKTDHFTWSIDSLSGIEGGTNLASFFKKNQLIGGSIVNNNTINFFFANENSITVYEKCNALTYTLTYLRDDNAPVYSGNRSYLNNKSKWYRIGANWYLWATVNSW